MYGYIYETTNLINNKKYIGKHKSNEFDTSYLGSGTILRKAIEKYGRENFSTKIIERINTNQDDLDLREMYWIKYFDAVNNKKYYNRSAGGKEEGWAGFNLAVKQNPKLHSNYGKKLSKTTREKISKAHKGKKLSDKTKEKLSKTHKGKTSPRKGKHLSQETKNKLSKANKGKTISKETREKISNTLKSRKRPICSRPPWNKGKVNVYSKETLEKMSKSAKKRNNGKMDNTNRRCKNICRTYKCFYR